MSPCGIRDLYLRPGWGPPERVLQTSSSRGGRVLQTSSSKDEFFTDEFFTPERVLQTSSSKDEFFKKDEFFTPETSSSDEFFETTRTPLPCSREGSGGPFSKTQSTLKTTLRGLQAPDPAQTTLESF